MPRQPLFVGKPALIVVDIQSDFTLPEDNRGIPLMPGFEQRIPRAERLLAAARDARIPVIFFQEVHRPSGVDFGRELDGSEGVHCVEGAPGTELWPTLRPRLDAGASRGGEPPGAEFHGEEFHGEEFHIVKRRYSGFIGTEFEIVLRGLGVSTLVLIGGLTDVCVHYTFADAHQRDYYARVVEDCVGGSSLAAHEAALNAMEYLQAGARRTTEEIALAFSAYGARKLTGASL